MNLILSHSSASSSRRKWVFKFLIFVVLSVLVFTTTVSAADYNVNSFYDATYLRSDINSIKLISYESTFQELQLEILNYDPAIFTQGRHYSFDSVFAIEYSSGILYTDTYTDAINDLIINGYSSEWYTHYIYGFTSYFEDSLGNQYELSAESYYVNPDECVVYADGICYTQYSDKLINTSTEQKLYIQIKVHFDFTVNFDVARFCFSWYPYQFRAADNVNANVRTSTNVDLSSIVSYDASTVGAMNLIAVDIKSQIAGMESALVSSLSDLMAQQDRYWDLLLGGYELSNFDYGMGILYEIVNYQDLTYSEILKIYSKVNSINTSVTNIKATSQSMLKLLNGSDRTLFDFLADNINILHEDLIDIKNYLDQIDNSSDLGQNIGTELDKFNSYTGDSDFSDPVLPEMAGSGSFSWFSSSINLVSFLLPFLCIAIFCIFLRMVFG